MIRMDPHRLVAACDASGTSIDCSQSRSPRLLKIRRIFSSFGNYNFLEDRGVQSSPAGRNQIFLPVGHNGIIGVAREVAANVLGPPIRIVDVESKGAAQVRPIQ